MTFPVARDIEQRKGPSEGLALCLSGGGYRAMLFHVGALWRLNEMGYLPRLDRVSSVSGGSITAGVLGMNWTQLQFNDHNIASNFQPLVVEPIRRLAGKTVDVWSVLKGLLPCSSVATSVANAYNKHLFHDKRLADLPADGPRFVLNATSLQTGVLFRFSRPYMADYRIGQVFNPDLPLATAVAASSAFPPFLSPMTFTLNPNLWRAAKPSEDCHAEPFLSSVVLTDGGVYDNLGLETIWKRYRTVLISDGGAAYPTLGKPPRNWLSHLLRVLYTIDRQVRSLRKQAAITAFTQGERAGTYWGITTDISAYGLSNTLPCPLADTQSLAATGTRLKRLPSTTQERLINWGYAVCDAGMRRWVDPNLSPPNGFPYLGNAVASTPAPPAAIN